MDLKANEVNSTVTTPERLVLPTVFHHGRDRALLLDHLSRQPSADHVVATMVLDLKDAFMGIPLALEEQPYNTCELDRPVYRHRPEQYPGEPRCGYFVAWSVLGFGGKPNPLVFARCAAFACRTAQALLRTSDSSPGAAEASIARLQMYVDDPTMTCLGSFEACSVAVDLVVLWWTMLGLPLSLDKGLFTTDPHRWIGAIFSARRAPSGLQSVITVPPCFASELLTLLKPFAAGKGHLSQSAVDQVLGKTGRLAYLIPTVRPYAAALWAGYAGARDAKRKRRSEAPPGRYAAKRFSKAASWVITLLEPPGDVEHLVPLESVITLQLPPIDPHRARAECDASPWGAGAVLYESDLPTSFFELAWTADMAQAIGGIIGSASSQTVFEYLALFLVLLAWGPAHRTHGLAIAGDNIGALSSALGLTGRGGMGRISRELAWRKVRQGLRFSAGHLPSEANVVADALSRTSAPLGADHKAFPEALLSVGRYALPDPASWFRCP